jgi:hypothetical protein
VLGGAGDVRDHLDAARARADDGDLLVGELVQPAVDAAAGVLVVPARGVEGVTLVVGDAIALS